MADYEIGLTPEEQAKLSQCVCPDIVQDAVFDYTPKLQDQIVNMMLQNDDCLDQASRVIKPQYFGSEYRERIVKLTLDYHKEYNGRPSREWLIQRHKEIYKTEESKQLLFRACLASVWDSSEPALHEMKALLDMMQDFARHQHTKLLYNQIARETTASGDYTRWDKVDAIKREWMIPSLVTKANPYATWDEVCAAADAQKEDWLIPNWAEFGCVTLFSSLPKLGKSTILAQLIADIMLARQFYGLDVQPAPVLLVDPENRERTTRRRIEHAIGGGEVGNLGEWFFRMNAFAKPLDLALLRKATNDVKAKTGQDHVVVFLDTLRSCYSGMIENENDNSEMSKIIVPLKDLAAETNACIFLIHHNAKGADTYAGGTAILGSVDYYWNWRNDRVKMHGQLSCWGRGDFTAPIELVFDPMTQRNKVYVPGVVQAKADALEADIVAIPVESPGVTREHLAEVWGVSISTVAIRIKSLVDSGRVVELKPANRKLGKNTYIQADFSLTAGEDDFSGG